MDPIKLELYRSLFTSVAEEMGLSLRRTAFSPNIKERRDYSCAVFDGEGQVIAQGDHMPVHLGSMPMSVRAAIAHAPMAPGDVVLLNDPYAGGTHLPDVTMVAPVYTLTDGPPPRRSTAKPRPLFYVANRAHHADIGGATPGSMGTATEIYQEGLRIPPVHLVRGGARVEDLWSLLLANVRGRAEREGDWAAQLGALQVGQERLLEMISRAGRQEPIAYARHLLTYAERLMRQTIRTIPDGTYQAEDCLDDDGVSSEPILLRVQIQIAGEVAQIDFEGSAAQVVGPLNAVEAITLSAVLYVFRCLLPGDTPASAGLLAPLTIRTPHASVVAATPPAPVAAGNVETSQRIVDLLFRALAPALPDRIPAASQGTMNNLTIGGWDPRRQCEFSYYETIAGGMGGRPGLPGLSAVHTHMTNSLNTPVEALEYSYPLLVHCYQIRRHSGGAGTFPGGDGIVREVELLAPAQVSLLSDRRRFAPWGLAGGSPGATGRNLLRRPHRPSRLLPGKFSLTLEAGTRLRIETPGGGGFGPPSAPPSS
jgi:N-methylhydantoinase B